MKEVDCDKKISIVHLIGALLLERLVMPSDTTLEKTSGVNKSKNISEGFVI
jgi:hypothetical protein